MSFINSHSRLTIDPCIQRAAKDVVRYAQEVARKSDHAASDLLITAVWSCLNCSCGLRTKPWPESAKKPANKAATTAKSKVTASLSNKDTTSKGTLNKPAQQSAGTCQNNSDKTGSQVNKDTDGKSSELSKKQYVDKSENTDNQTEEIDDAIVLSDDVDGDDFEIELNPEVSDDKSGAVNGKEADSNDNDDKNEDLLDMDCDEIDEEEEHQLLYDEKKDEKKTGSANKPETDLSEDDEITIITDDDDKQSNDESKNTKSVDAGKDKVKKTNIVSRSDVISLDTDSDEGGLAKHRKNVCSETNIDTVRIKTECDMDDMMMDTDSPTKNTATGLRNYEKDFVEAPTAQAEMDTVVDVKVELDTNEYDISRRTIPPVPPETEAHTSPQTNLVLPQPGTSFAQTDTSLTQSSIMPNLGTIQQAVSQPQVQNMLVPSMLGLVPLQQAGQSSCPQPNTITETTITYYTQSGSGVPGGQKIQVIERQSLITDSCESPPSKMRLLDFDKKWHSAPKVDLEQEKVTERDFLPKPECPAVNAANVEVLKELQSMPRAGVKRKRGSYGSYTPELRCKIAKYAMEHSNIKTAKHFSIELNREINESTVRFIKAAYLKKARSEEDFASTSNVLPKSPRGRPLKIGKHEVFVRDYINKLIASGGVVNNRIIISAAKGFIQSEDKSLLAENGGKLKLTKDWATSLMKRMGLTKGKGSKGSEKYPENFTEVQSSFLERISEKVQAHQIPDSLVINWDQTACNFVPDSSWGMDEEGSKQVQIAHMEDRRQMTVVLACTKSGSLLAPQLIYQGRSAQCHADYEFPEDWDIHHTETHGSTAESMERFLNKVILPYIEQIKTDCNLPKDQHCLCVFNFANAHPGEEWRELLNKHNIHTVYVPASCTDKLQPLDLSIYPIIKQNMKQCFESWYADQISNQLRSGSDASDLSVDLRMSVIKPLHAMWLTQTLQNLAQQQSIIQYGWMQAGFIIINDAAV